MTEIHKNIFEAASGVGSDRSFFVLVKTKCCQKEMVHNSGEGELFFNPDCPALHVNLFDRKASCPICGQSPIFFTKHEAGTQSAWSWSFSSLAPNTALNQNQMESKDPPTP